MLRANSDCISYYQLEKAIINIELKRQYFELLISLTLFQSRDIYISPRNSLK